MFQKHDALAVVAQDTPKGCPRAVSGKRILNDPHMCLYIYMYVCTFLWLSFWLNGNYWLLNIRNYYYINYHWLLSNCCSFGNYFPFQLWLFGSCATALLPASCPQSSWPQLLGMFTILLSSWTSNSSPKGVFLQLLSILCFSTTSASWIWRKRKPQSRPGEQINTYALGFSVPKTTVVLQSIWRWCTFRYSGLGQNRFY